MSTPTKESIFRTNEEINEVNNPGNYNSDTERYEKWVSIYTSKLAQLIYEKQLIESVLYYDGEFTSLSHVPNPRLRLEALLDSEVSNGEITICEMDLQKAKGRLHLSKQELVKWKIKPENKFCDESNFYIINYVENIKIMNIIDFKTLIYDYDGYIVRVGENYLAESAIEERVKYGVIDVVPRG